MQIQVNLLGFRTEKKKNARQAEQQRCASGGDTRETTPAATMRSTDARGARITREQREGTEKKKREMRKRIEARGSEGTEKLREK